MAGGKRKAPRQSSRFVLTARQPCREKCDSNVRPQHAVTFVRLPVLRSVGALLAGRTSRHRSLEIRSSCILLRWSHCQHVAICAPHVNQASLLNRCACHARGKLRGAHATASIQSRKKNVLVARFVCSVSNTILVTKIQILGSKTR